MLRYQHIPLKRSSSFASPKREIEDILVLFHNVPIPYLFVSRIKQLRKLWIAGLSFLLHRDQVPRLFLSIVKNLPQSTPFLHSVEFVVLLNPPAPQAFFVCNPMRYELGFDETTSNHSPVASKLKRTYFID